MTLKKNRHNILYYSGLQLNVVVLLGLEPKLF